MYCTNTENEILDRTGKHKNLMNKKFKTDRLAPNNIKECFTEYSLEDKIEALKIVLTHNERHTKDLPLHKDTIYAIKKIIGVKECLQGDRETPFQTLISELRNTVMNSYWNKEVGRTRYQIPNLPKGMDPLETTFGKKTESRLSMTELLKTKISENILDPNVLQMYKKSHNSYQPAEQIKRDYKEPFNQNLYFGKSKTIDNRGARVKRLLQWINSDPITVVNSILADFMERSHPRVGEVRNLKNTYSYLNMVHGKPNEKKVINLLNDCIVNNDVVLQKEYLQYINGLRQSLKGRIPDALFIDMSEELFSLDKEYVGFLPEDEVFSILGKHKICINKTLLAPLLDLLQIRKEKNVNYKELLNLLNWKYHFPELPKIEKIPLECQYYSTEYKETIGKMEKVDIASIPTAGVSSDPSGDKTSAYSLIFPSIFTRYGLSHSDLNKLRSKEEIRNIFENIGVQFPDNNFDLLWEKGLKENSADNLSVDIFKSLIEQYNSMTTRD